MYNFNFNHRETNTPTHVLKLYYLPSKLVAAVATKLTTAAAKPNKHINQIALFIKHLSMYGLECVVVVNIYIKHLSMYFTDIEKIVQ